MKFKRFICVAIIVAVFAGVLGSVVNPRRLVAQKLEPTPTPIQEVTPYTPRSCQELEVKEGKHKIILQINDVQAYAWRTVVTQMINDANRINAPVVLSVVPQNIHNDEELVQFTQDNKCRLEIAQQGSRVTSGGSEFKGMSKEEAKDRLVEGKSVLEWVLKTKVSTLVPPYNWYSQQLLKTIEEVGYKAISIEGTLRQFYGVPTYNYYRKKLTTITQIVSNCKLAFTNARTCVVILYPSQFENDNYENYKKLLTALSEIKDVQFTTFNK